MPAALVQRLRVWIRAGHLAGESRRRRRTAGALVACALGLTSARADAQTTILSPGVTFTVGYELHRDRLRYEFQNPSTFDTSFLVPHRFVQTYEADNQWLVTSARFPLFGDMTQVEFGRSPETLTFGSDLDTFYDPNGDVIVSGTASDVSMHAWRVAYWSEGRLFGLPWRIGYVFRRDVTVFHSTERLQTHTLPPSETHTPINTHETTYSDVHQLPIGVSDEMPLGPRWTLSGGADVSPFTFARLTTQLPEKYPGQDIVFEARALDLDARVQLLWKHGRFPAAITVKYDHSWSYQESSQFTRNDLQLGVHVGFQP